MSRQHTVDVTPEEDTNTAEADEIMEEPEDQEDGYSSSTPTSTLTWISWFCSLPGHEYFCEVTEDFIEDDFNLTGLNTMVPFWKEAMEMVLDVEPDEDASKIPDVSLVESSAEMLYGLVHQRYILTRVGLQAMVEKYESGVFGCCPRVYCLGCNVVPSGRSDLPGLDTVKLFCPNCNDIYIPPSSRFQGVDGAFFGTTFPHLFFQSYRELAPAPFWKPPSSGGSSLSPGRGQRSGASASSSSSSRAGGSAPFVNPNPHGGQKRAAGYVYVPRIYGFKVSERAKSGPRMAWLRMRPESPSELDQVDWRGRWIGDELDGDEEDDEGDDGEHKLESFDSDQDDEDDEEEEEEEEETRPAQPDPSTLPRTRRADAEMPFNLSSLPPSPLALDLPGTQSFLQAKGSNYLDSQPAALPSHMQTGGGTVHMVRQWVPRADMRMAPTALV